jgi:cytochrome c-type biogenesis protein CcmH/NrfF
MSPAIKYSLARVGMFIVVALALTPLHLNLWVQLMIAILVTAVLSYFVLRKWRDEMAVTIERSMSQRKQQKQHLRAALSGEDEQKK